MSIVLPELLDHQIPWEEDTARYLILRYGRRSGKDVADLVFSVMGRGYGPCPHPPGRCQRDRTKLKDHCWAGLVDGLSILWIPRDYPQATSIWDQEIVARFETDNRVHLDNKDHEMTLPNGARLLLKSPENIRSVAGLGKDIGGAVMNECAWYDLFKTWKSVIRPLLADNVGWACFSSTTNADWDGNTDEMGKRVLPSFFNRLCLEVMSGARGPSWSHHYGTAKDNPEIDPAEFEDLVKEYTPGSLDLKQEVHAELVTAGAGLAFPQWDTRVHLAPWQALPREDAIVLGMDWGIASPSVVIACSIGTQKTITGFREWVWKDKDAYDAGYDFASDLLDQQLPQWPEWMVADSAMNDRTGVGGTTILTEFQGGINAALAPYRTPPLNVIPAPKGPGSRAVMFDQITKVLSWGPALADGTIPASRMPRFQIMKLADGRPSCPQVGSDLATAVRHPTKDEVDKDKSPSHGLEALGYLLATALPQAARIPRSVPENIHPGFLPTGQRRARDRTPEIEAEESRIVQEWRAKQEGVEIGGRYGRPPRRR